MNIELALGSQGKVCSPVLGDSSGIHFTFNLEIYTAQTITAEH